MSDFRIWGVVPAAGSGRRFGRVGPKQYVLLAGRPVLSWSLRALLGVEGISGITVALGAEDPHWAGIDEAHHPLVRACLGGAERQDSVRAALRDLLARGADEWDRVLVHDAARPGLRTGQAEELVDAVGDDVHGGLLALPVGDTLKHSPENRQVQKTIPRDCLWAAQTPQYFPIGLLLRALERAVERGLPATDEASAMEQLGYRPRLVVGSLRNMKLTHVSDREALELLLSEPASASDISDETHLAYLRERARG